MTGLYRKPYMPSGAPANDERVAEVIRQGKRMMPGYAQTLDDAQIADLIAYLKSL
jgi:mono/diheme cytochrome c family protein